MIAGAAVEILGREGSRGLTHRAVERDLGLPPGTTSAYFPKRIDLLRAAFTFLLERDFAVLEAHFKSPLVAQAHIDIDEAALFVDDLAHKIMNISVSSGLARYEFHLMAARNSDFADIQSWMFRVREEHWFSFFIKLGAQHPLRAARTFDILLRGVFHTKSLFREMDQSTDVTFFRKLLVFSLSE